MVALILANLILLGSSRLRLWVRVVAVQGLMLGLLPIVAGAGGGTVEVMLLAAVSIGLRGLCFPWLLSRVLRDVNVRHEVEPFVGYTFSLLFGVLALVGSVWVGSRTEFAFHVASPLMIPVAIFTVAVGLFLIVSRKKAISQVMGYLVIENGIYVLGVSLMEEVPVLVELGVLLDAFVAVFVMSIATYHISREFDHIDVHELDTLKG